MVAEVVEREALVRKIQFPRMAIPVSVVLTASFNLGLNLLVAAACSWIAVPTIVMVWHGFSGHGTDAITSSAHVFVSSMWGSVTVSNLLTSIVDS